MPGAPTLSSAFSIQAHPSNHPLPDAWQGTERLTVQSPVETPAADSAPLAVPALTVGTCGKTYQIQAGDALGEIAKKCGVSLADLLAANSSILNPNRVYPGEEINLPGGQAGTGGGSPPPSSAGVSGSNGFQPGSVLEISASGLPPTTAVRISLGLSSTGLVVLGERQTDAAGRLAVSLALPSDAPPGETGFILLTSLGSPTIQRTSDTFVIGKP